MTITVSKLVVTVAMVLSVQAFGAAGSGQTASQRLNHLALLMQTNPKQLEKEYVNALAHARSHPGTYISLLGARCSDDVPYWSATVLGDVPTEGAIQPLIKMASGDTSKLARVAGRSLAKLYRHGHLTPKSKLRIERWAGSIVKAHEVALLTSAIDCIELSPTLENVEALGTCLRYFGMRSPWGQRVARLLKQSKFPGARQTLVEEIDRAQSELDSFREYVNNPKAQ